MQENKLQIAKSILELTTKGDLKQSFDLVIGLMKELRNDIRGEIFTNNAQNKKDLMELLSYIQKTETKLTKLISNSDGKIIKSSKELSSLVKEVSKLDKKISEIDDSLSVNLGKRINLFEYKIKELESKIDDNEVEELEDDVEYLLNRVKDLEYKFNKFSEYESPTRNPLFGFRLVRHDDTLTGDGTMQNPLSVVGGGGGGGGGFSIETPTGSVNGSNVTFTVTQTPVYIVSDGTTYFDGAGYTIAGLTVTMTVAPSSFIRNFYGGSGTTVETPSGTIDGANAIFTVTSTPDYIVSDGATYFDGAGYTIVGLTVTMTVPPSSFIRSFY